MNGLRTGLAILALALGVCAPAAEAYRGFAIDDSAARNLTDLPEILDATRQQIDMLYVVGLPEDMLTFFQSVKLRIISSDDFKRPSPGRYRHDADRSVHLSTGIIRVRTKPILLHELLHAYHDQRLPKGMKNPDVLAQYAKAQSIRAFAAKSHMMANAGEYFACTGTTYLYGVTNQEPFRREKIQEQQPAAFAYFKALFGPGAGKFQGSIDGQATDE